MFRSPRCSATCPCSSSQRASAGGSCASTRNRIRSSGDAQDGMVRLARGELERGGDVLGLQVGVVGQDLLAAGARRQQVEDVGDAHAQAANTRAPGALFRPDRDAVQFAHAVLLTHRGTQTNLAQRTAVKYVMCWPP